MGRRSRKIRFAAFVFTLLLPFFLDAAPTECRLAVSDCNYPFPDDRLLTRSNRSASGKKWAYPEGDYHGLWAVAHADGFSPLSHIWIETPCSIRGRFPEHFGIDPSQKFYLYNTGIERPVPLTVKLHRTWLCLLEIIPDEVLRPGNTHLLVVRGLTNEQNRPLELATAFDQQDPGDPLYAERAALLPAHVPRHGIQTVVSITVRSYENMLGTFLHLRNKALARFDPATASMTLKQVAGAPGEVRFTGTISLPWICQREIPSGVCRLHVSDAGRTEYSDREVERTFFISLPASGASAGLLIPALVYQQPDVVASLGSLQKLLTEGKLAAFGFTDQRTFLTENRKPLEGLPPSLPGFVLSRTDHDRLTSIPDREAVRIIHGILLTRMMTQRIPEEISKLMGRGLRLNALRGLALDTERDTFALSVNPFVDRLVVVAAPQDPRGLPFGPRGTLPEKEFVRLFWDGMDFANYQPILRARKAMPDSQPQKSLTVQSLLVEADRKESVRFLRN